MKEFAPVQTFRLWIGISIENIDHFRIPTKQITLIKNMYYGTKCIYVQTWDDGSWITYYWRVLIQTKCQKKLNDIFFFFRW